MKLNCRRCTTTLLDDHSSRLNVLSVDYPNTPLLRLTLKLRRKMKNHSPPLPERVPQKLKSEPKHSPPSPLERGGDCGNYLIKYLYK